MTTDAHSDSAGTPPACPQCDTVPVRVGAFWICPNHGQVPEPRPFSPLRVFLSYGHDDNETLVRLIKSDLERRGHDVWFDKSEIKAGDDWRRAITDGITGCHKFVSFLSKHSTRDPGVCRDEITIALGVKGGNIQTILVESEQDVRPPVNIGHIQWLDMHDWKTWHGAGPNTWNDWYQSRLAEIIRVVESDESRRFAGEIETLNGYLRPIRSDSLICQLLSRGFVGREWLFEKVERWRCDRSSDSRLFWILGSPGVGKSAFAAQLTFTRSDTVVAAQFCQWDKTDHRNARRVVRSLAFQLATRFPDYRKLLLSLPEISELDDKNADDLFDYLLANPLRSVIHGGRDRYLIVIDALDEAGDSTSNPLVEMLARNTRRLPDWLGLVVTSRPEFEVKTLLQHLSPVVLDTTTESNRDDLRSYLRQQLSQPLQARIDANSLLDQILAKSEGVFLYVERFCDDVRQGRLSLDHPEQFPQGLGGIFLLYCRRRFPDQDEYRTQIEPSLGVLLAAREPLPVDMLKRLFSWRSTELQRRLQTLGSLFPITNDAGEEVIRPYHRSLAEWLTDPRRAGEFLVDVEAGSKALADFCAREAFQKEGSRIGYVQRQTAAHLLADRRWPELFDVIRKSRLNLLDRWTARGEADEGAACLRGLIGYLVTIGQQDRAAELSTQLARVLTQQGEHEAARNHLQQALRWVSDSPAGLTHSVAWHELGSLLLYQGLSQEAADCYQKALRVANESSPVNHREVAANLIGLATIARSLENHAEAESLAREAAQQAETAADVRHLIAARQILANALRSQMRLEESRSELVLARMLCVLHDLPFDETAVLLSEAWLVYERAIVEPSGITPADASETLFETALERARRARHLHGEVEAHLGLTWCALTRGDLAQAESAFDAAATVGVGDKYHELASALRVGRASLALLRGDLTAAEQLYADARTFCEKVRQTSWQTDCCVGLAAVHHRQGNVERLHETECEAHTLAAQCGLHKERLVQAGIERVRSDSKAVPY